MSQFGQLKKLAVPRSQTKDLPLEIVLKAGGQPVILEVLPATQQNEAYWNALVKSPVTKKMAKGGVPTARQLAASQAEDVALFANHVIRGWKNVFDDAGVAITFTTAACLDFLQMLLENAPDIFGTIRGYVGDLGNFRDVTLDGEQLAGNS